MKNYKGYYLPSCTELNRACRAAKVKQKKTIGEVRLWWNIRDGEFLGEICFNCTTTAKKYNYEIDIYDYAEANRDYLQHQIEERIRLGRKQLLK